MIRQLDARLTHRKVVTKNSDCWFAVHQIAAAGSFSLIAGDEYRILGIAEPMKQVVKNSSASHHSTG